MSIELNKKTLAIFITMSFASVAHANTGVLNITGNIIDPACTLTNANNAIAVTMDNISKTDFTNAGIGQPVAAKQINLQLSCVSNGNATVRFGGTSDRNNPDLLQLTQGTGTATGVAVGFYEDNGNTLIPLGTNAPTTPVIGTANAPGNYRLTYYAAYVATVAPDQITNGEANAVANFTVVTN